MCPRDVQLRMLSEARLASLKPVEALEMRNGADYLSAASFAMTFSYSSG